ncbi:UmuC domain [Trypanosoma melophagium]|uniref:UmuC domain n=1 Tax=Trypanosoma melophagium TaxID=715481 RepID=UPI00351A6B09|nr:UmuC domain [Trypanosoma melophagium]
MSLCGGLFRSCTHYGNSILTVVVGSGRLRRGDLWMYSSSSSLLTRVMYFHSDSPLLRRSGPKKKREFTGLALTEEEEEQFKNINLDMDLEPVDLIKLKLPLHTMETIPPDVIANLVAKDKTIVFSPLRKEEDIRQRIERMRHHQIIQPLGKVLHFRFFMLNDSNNKEDLQDITPETFQRIKEFLRSFTRFIVTDERWPVELSIEISPLISEDSQKMRSEDEVVKMLSDLFAEQLRIGAWCGMSSTPVMAKMACNDGQKEHSLTKENLISGGIIHTKKYDLPTHESLKKFVADIPLSSIPVMGPAQVQLLKEVYGITKCGEVALYAERIGYSLSQATMEFFYAVGNGIVRVRSEVGTTMFRKAPRCKAAQVRREAKYGRVVSAEQFIDTVMNIFDTVYKDLVVHDYVTGRVTIDTRRTIPRIFWVTEEYEDIQPRTNDRELLREVVHRLAKRFAPRRNEELLDMYTVSIHFADIRTWSEEHELKEEPVPETTETTEKPKPKVLRAEPSRRTPSPLSPGEKKQRIRSRSHLAREKEDSEKPRGIVVVM